MIKDASAYFVDGCGRCDHFATDLCKARKWSEPLQLLREILLDSGLNEEVKWGQPTYTLKGKNVAMLFAFKDTCGITFFKGMLLRDDGKLLVPAGANSNAARVLKVISSAEVETTAHWIRNYLEEAISLEQRGAKVPKSDKQEQMPEALLKRLAEDHALNSAWNELTPGRQRGFILHITGAKQEQTQQNRIEKCIPKIFAGKGINEYL